MPRLLVRYEDLSLRPQYSEATNIGEENILFPVMTVLIAPIDLKDLLPLLRRKDHDGNGAGIDSGLVHALHFDHAIDHAVENVEKQPEVYRRHYDYARQQPKR